MEFNVQGGASVRLFNVAVVLALLGLGAAALPPASRAGVSVGINTWGPRTGLPRASVCLWTAAGIWPACGGWRGSTLPWTALAPPSPS